MKYTTGPEIGSPNHSSILVATETIVSSPMPEVSSRSEWQTPLTGSQCFPQAWVA